jgi:hypothetical protein
MDAWCALITHRRPTPDQLPEMYVSDNAVIDGQPHTVGDQLRLLAPPARRAPRGSRVPDTRLRLPRPSCRPLPPCRQQPQTAAAQPYSCYHQAGCLLGLRGVSPHLQSDPASPAGGALGARLARFGLGTGMPSYLSLLQEPPGSNSGSSGHNVTACPAAAGSRYRPPRPGTRRCRDPARMRPGHYPRRAAGLNQRSQSQPRLPAATPHPCCKTRRLSSSSPGGRQCPPVVAARLRRWWLPS